ncbi:hypothetical protein IB270_34715 [Ensifer sp. ENS05]|uniref:hypothetical protein n=1 Tax=Ensifer sp. ENS05 TaxID=2769277 RepID=UPI00177EF5AC|nr:hypothetical protein [Ensifer sp. ENS05]MBD9597980.1 hypothetical protein [Ensifer sp. ENS05]
MGDISWKTVLQGLKLAIIPDRDARIKATIQEVAGPPLALRDARKRLFLLASAAIGGQPALISIGEDAVVCVISLSDLVQVLAGPPPTLADVMDQARTTRA